MMMNSSNKKNATQSEKLQPPTNDEHEQSCWTPTYLPGSNLMPSPHIHHSNIIT